MDQCDNSPLKRVTQLEATYQRALQRIELAQVTMQRLKQRQQENRERLTAIKRQLNELQIKIDSEKVKYQLGS